MKPIEEITQEDFTAFKKHKQMSFYTTADVVELDNLIKTYINRYHQTCLGCQGSLRAAKDVANLFLANNSSKIEEALKASQIQEMAQTQKTKRKVK